MGADVPVRKPSWTLSGGTATKDIDLPIVSEPTSATGRSTQDEKDCRLNDARDAMAWWMPRGLQPRGRARRPVTWPDHGARMCPAPAPAGRPRRRTGPRSTRHPWRMIARIGVVSAAPAVDRTHVVPALRPGTIHRPATVLALPGGKGFNVAAVLRTLGMDVVVAAPLAGATGRWLAEAAAARGLDVRATWIPGELRTCLSVFSEEDARLTEFYEPPLHVGPDDWARFVTDAVDAMTQPGLDAVVVSGKVPPGPPPDGLAAIVRAVAAIGRFVAVDSDGPGLQAAIDVRPVLVKVNGAEAGALLGVTVDTADAAGRAAGTLRAMGPASAVVTLGRDGAVGVDPDGAAWRVHPVTADGRFPTGSGDAFMAGMVTALTTGASFPEALRVATGAATANTEQPGAGLVDPGRAAAIAATVRVEAFPR